MKTDTALASAMRKAGMDTDEALLFNVAVDCLRKQNGDPARAVPLFTEEIRDAMGMARKLFSEEETHARALSYLQTVSKDMKNPPRGGARSIANLDLRRPGGRADQREDEGVLKPGGFDEPRPPCGSSSSRSYGGAVRVIDAGRALLGRTANPPRGLSAVTAISTYGGVSIFDTYKVRHIPVGDLRFGELNTMIATSKREAALLKMIRDFSQVENSSMKVRDVIKMDELQRMIQRAAEVSDA